MDSLELTNDKNTRLVLSRNDFVYIQPAGETRFSWNEIDTVEQKSGPGSLEINQGKLKAVISANEFPDDDVFPSVHLIIAYRIPAKTKNFSGTYTGFLNLDKISEIGLMFEKWGLLEQAEEILRRGVDVTSARIINKQPYELSIIPADAHIGFLRRHGREGEVQELYGR